MIGVDRAGDLPPLNAACQNGSDIAHWLRAEGFDVKLLVDSEKPVTIRSVYGAVDEVLSKDNCRQLVVYFAGHGFTSAYSEYWLLSEAPKNPNEAVSLVETTRLALQTGIFNVIFISDACRSTADSLRAQQVRGSVIFPIPQLLSQRPSKVDQFFATHVGEPAWEVPVSKSITAYTGIYTATFLDAYRHPTANMVVSIDTKRVVTNQHLEEYLEKEVPRRLQKKSLLLRQSPDAQVTSGDRTYIGSAGKLITGRVGQEVEQKGDFRPIVATLFDVAQSQLQLAGVRGIGVPDKHLDTATLNLAAQATGFARVETLILNASALSDSVDALSGFVISGMTIKYVVSGPAVAATAQDETHVWIDLRGARAASIALRFSNGSGAVIAALDGYVGNLVFDGSGLTSVSYVPTIKNPLWGDYATNAKRTARMHAALATSARFGVFRVAEQHSEEPWLKDENKYLVEQFLRDLEPTLGMYSAYAYANAGLQPEVEAIAIGLQKRLGIDLFDIAVLSGSMRKREAKNRTGVFPFVPMLAQGWNLLRVANVKLSERVLAFRNSLKPSLWTTLDMQAMEIAEAMLRKGEVQ
ncbi:caspase family protein [Paraburkholderia metrosideri]|uniref:caspase family protein n=1 Tax=Paraburkholderia metrosideri TaxID=580937 RepID=UPI00191B0DE1|nr:caspase family protein [Paraburkholderia metrosideri]